jgi:hypothetical protein
MYIKNHQTKSLEKSRQCFNIIIMIGLQNKHTYLDSGTQRVISVREARHSF